jgi:hypothetical protein
VGYRTWIAPLGRSRLVSLEKAGRARSSSTTRRSIAMLRSDITRSAQKG